MGFEAVAIACLVGLVLVFWLCRWSSSANGLLPAELRGARLVYAERLFRSPEPVTITAKVDRVYRNATDNLVLVELKTRVTNRVYWSDVIELSAQRLALMWQTGEAVADYGYVLTERPDGRRTGCRRIRLMEPVDLIALVERRERLLAGKAEPQPTCKPEMCQKCAFVRPCDPPWR